MAVDDEIDITRLTHSLPQSLGPGIIIVDDLNANK